MADESYVQVALDGAGKEIRNLHVVARTQDTEGLETLHDRYVQVVAVSDSTGHVLDFDLSALVELMTDIRTELRILNMQLLVIADGRSQPIDPIQSRKNHEFADTDPEFDT